jgi:FMN reductase
MNVPENGERFRLVVISASTSDPSSTRLLADRTAERAAALAARHWNTVTVSVIELREISADISTEVVSQLIAPKLQKAITTLGEADGIIASTPVYKAGPSGLFTSFFHVLDNDLLIGKPVVLAATSGTARHALVTDDQMRPLFAYLRALTVPTSLFAAPEDWSDPALAKRIDRAALGSFSLPLAGAGTSRTNGGVLGIAAVRRRRGRAAREAGRDLGLSAPAFSAVSVPFQACPPGWASNGIASGTGPGSPIGQGLRQARWPATARDATAIAVRENFSQ